jgi:hypothetical protein
MKRRDDLEHAAGTSQAYRNVNKRLASALEVPEEHTEFPSVDFELNAKRVEYKTKLLKLREGETKKAGKPIRHPRLDTTRKRPLPTR